MRLAGVVALVAALCGGDLANRSPEPGHFVPGHLLVKFDPDTSRQAIARSLARAGGRTTGTIPGVGIDVVVVEAGRETRAANLLRSDPVVERVERDVTVQAHAIPNDTYWGAQSGSQEVSAPAAWDLTTGSPSTVVAVLDSGIDAAHPDLAGSTRPGHDFVNGDADATDDNGHGTESAGVAAARGNNSTGVAGLCWSCTILPVKVLGPTGEGTTATLASGLVWAADQGARVINISIGGPATTQTLTDAVRYAAGKGAVLVASAGNDGTTTPNYPAAYPEVIGVASTTPAKTLYAFSSRGDWVRLAAPGCNPTTFPAGAYLLFCGTSSSAPVVSGIAALAISLRPTATKAAVERALERSARPIAEPGVRYGLVDAHAALVALEATFRPAEASSGPVAPQAPPPAPAQPTPPALAPPVSPGTPPAPRPRVVPPATLRAPAVSGRARVGRILLARRGSWSGTTPLTFRYRWYRCRSIRSGCKPVTRANGLRYRVVRRDRGLRIRFSVTARNAAGVAFRISRPTARVPR